MSADETLLEAAARWEPESPFFSEALMDRPAPVSSAETNSQDSPFTNELFVGETIETFSPEREQFASVLEELYDDEFDELLYQVAEEAVAAYGDLAATQGEMNGHGTSPEAFLQQYLEPLRVEADRLLDQFTAAVGERDVTSMSDQELDGLLDGVNVGASELGPVFEQFLGGLVSKVKKVVKKAATVAKTTLAKLSPIHLILARLKRMIRPLLDRVLKLGLNKLPPSLRPAATQLAKRILGEVPATPDEEFEDPVLASADVSSIQQEFDIGVASLMFAADPVEGEMTLAESIGQVAPDDGTIARLHQARERFIGEVAVLPPGADPTPAVERFLPAILPVVRMGIRIIGRPRVVSFLSSQLARLISRFVGRQGADSLSRAIVDAGLRLLNLEVSDELDGQTGAAAISATVEDTIRRVAELDETYLEDEALLEAATYDAFQAAAGGNIPPSLLKPHVRPVRTGGTWVMLPLRGRKLYKKFTRPLSISITPQIARRILTRDGSTLDTFLQETYGIDGDVSATAHLFEALPGTRPALIARAETGVAGLGSVSPHAWTGLHPLTEEAAGLLFREPGLGSAAGETSDAASPVLAIGERLFYLEIPGATPTPVSPRTAVSRRPTQIRVQLDTTGGRLVAHIYLNERTAQQVVAETGQAGDVTAIAARIIQAVDSSLDDVLVGRYARRLRVILGDRLPRGGHRTLLRRLRVLAPRLRPLRLGRSIAGWLNRALASTARLPADLASAVADQRDGITVIVTFSGIEGLSALRQLLMMPVRALMTTKQVPKIGEPVKSSVRVVPGFEW